MNALSSRGALIADLLLVLLAAWGSVWVLLAAAHRPEHHRRRSRTLLQRTALGDLFNGPYG